MTTTCPNGHWSGTADYCDDCGARMGTGASTASAEPTTTDRIGTTRPTDPEPGSTDGTPCPSCATPRDGGGRFCESCGAELDAECRSAEPSPWMAEVAVDATRYTDGGRDGLVVPTDRPVTVIPIVDRVVTIGRRGHVDDAPVTIDLRDEWSDPGVSRHHATIECDPTGTWTVTDAGSTNGTTVDDDDRPIPPHVPVPLADGSRIHVGAWTTITLHATDAAG